LTDAERLRVVHLLITSPEREGGAGVTPGLDGWNYVDSIFPLHDSKFNRVAPPSYRERTLTVRNGFNPGLANGRFMIRNWIRFEIISVRNSLFTLPIRNIISSPSSLSPLWAFSLISFCPPTTCCTPLASWSGQWDSNILGRGGNEIFP